MFWPAVRFVEGFFEPTPIYKYYVAKALIPSVIVAPIGIEVPYIKHILKITLPPKSFSPAENRLYNSLSVGEECTGEKGRNKNNKTRPCVEH